MLIPFPLKNKQKIIFLFPLKYICFFSLCFYVLVDKFYLTSHCLLEKSNKLTICLNYSPKKSAKKIKHSVYCTSSTLELKKSFLFTFWNWTQKGNSPFIIGLQSSNYNFLTTPSFSLFCEYWMDINNILASKRKELKNYIMDWAGKQKTQVVLPDYC